MNSRIQIRCKLLPPNNQDTPRLPGKSLLTVTVSCKGVGASSDREREYTFRFRVLGGWGPSIGFRGFGHLRHTRVPQGTGQSSGKDVGYRPLLRGYLDPPF